MKKLLLFILCLVCITSNYSYAFSQQELKEFEASLQNSKQIILKNFTKDNKLLTQEELNDALNRTRSELYLLVKTERKYDVKTDNICYPNGVIKQTKIIESDGRITYEYFNIYGISVGTLTYKNNKLISTSRPEPIEKPNIVSTNNGSSDTNKSNSDKIYSVGGKLVSYQGDRIYSIGGELVSYQGDRIYSIGGELVSYQGDRIYSIGKKLVSYQGGRIYSIGGELVSY